MVGLINVNVQEVKYFFIFYDLDSLNFFLAGNVWTMTMIHAINSSADLDRFENEGTPGTKRALEDVSAWEENKSLPHPAVYLSHNRLLNRNSLFLIITLYY